MSTVQNNYPAGTQTITISPENVASSATFVAGWESNSISNVGNLDLDHLVSGIWTCGTTPTVNTQVQIWVMACLTDDLSSTVTWPDVFDGTSSAETVTNVGVLQSAGRLGAVINVSATTSNVAYPVAPFSVAALFGGVLPTRYVLFISHNTGVNSNSTTGNHSWQYLRMRATVA